MVPVVADGPSRVERIRCLFVSFPETLICSPSGWVEGKISR